MRKLKASTPHRIKFDWVPTWKVDIKDNDIIVCSVYNQFKYKVVADAKIVLSALKLLNNDIALVHPRLLPHPPDIIQTKQRTAIVKRVL